MRWANEPMLSISLICVAAVLGTVILMQGITLITGASTPGGSSSRWFLLPSAK